MIPCFYGNYTYYYARSVVERIKLVVKHLEL